MVVGFLAVFAVLLGLVLWSKGYENVKQHLKLLKDVLVIVGRVFALSIIVFIWMPFILVCIFLEDENY